MSREIGDDDNVKYEMYRVIQDFELRGQHFLVGMTFTLPTPQSLPLPRKPHAGIFDQFWKEYYMVIRPVAGGQFEEVKL